MVMVVMVMVEDSGRSLSFLVCATYTILHESAKSCRRRFSCTLPAKSAEKFAEKYGKLPPIATLRRHPIITKIFLTAFYSLRLQPSCTAKNPFGRPDIRLIFFGQSVVGAKKVDNTYPCRKTESRLGQQPRPKKLSTKGRLSLLSYDLYAPIAKLADVCLAIKLSIPSAFVRFLSLALDTPGSLLPLEKDQFMLSRTLVVTLDDSISDCGICLRALAKKFLIIFVVYHGKFNSFAYRLQLCGIIKLKRDRKIEIGVELRVENTPETCRSRLARLPQEILITKVITIVTVDTINGIIPCDKRNCTVTERQLTAPFSRANGALPHVYLRTRTQILYVTVRRLPAHPAMQMRVELYIPSANYRYIPQAENALSYYSVILPLGLYREFILYCNSRKTAVVDVAPA
ncbi:hypothetical protein ALC53_09255 [Atta colombica]|uniref:Uncharacterized protein n=1 Tax=Atta colombica TaxID=520822 RepID=A0A195B6N1_9HYME|nr:hypothetical protein ALC53_09255 [Atta colombica]